MVDLAAGRSKEKQELLKELLTESDDTEITLGTGKLLGIFFGLVFVCAIFFTLGYMLGHSTASGDKTDIVGGPPATGGASGRPAAGNKNVDTPPPSAGPA